MDVDGTSGVTFVRPRRKVTKVCSVAKGDFPARDTQIRTFSEDRFIPELRMPAG